MQRRSLSRAACAAFVGASLAVGCGAPSVESPPSPTSSGEPVGTDVSERADEASGAVDGDGSGDGGDESAGQGTDADRRPRITYAGPAPNGYEVTALVPDVVEEGGVCTVTARAPDHDPVTVRLEAIADAGSTSCGAAAFDSLAPGSWEIIVTYSGSSGSGTSDPFVMEVER